MRRYTLPGWFAFFMVLALMAFFAWGFTDPTEENEHRVMVGPARHCLPPIDRC